MLIKTKQNKNGNLVCLASLSELEKQTSSQKDKHTHSKHGEGAARRREHLETREQWERTQPGMVQKGTSCPQGEQEGEKAALDADLILVYITHYFQMLPTAPSVL